MSQSARFIFYLALLTLGFRILFLAADPPANFSWSGGYFADEGYWSHNARNAVLFGNPVQDEWDACIVSPLFAFVQNLSFRALGPGLAQVRLVGLLSSLVISIAMFLLLRKQFDARIAFLGGALASLNYPMLVLGRQGILDPFATAFAALAMLFALSQSLALCFLAGAAFAAACTTKYLMIYLFLPVLFLPDSTKLRISFVAGLCVAGSVWLMANYLPNHQLLTAYSGFYSSQQSWQPAAVLKNIVLQPFYLYFVKTPAVLFFGNALAWYFLGNLKSANRTEKGLWLWLVCGIVFFALWRYRPLRYYTSLLPPLAALAAIALTKLEDLSEAARKKPWMWLGLFLPAVQILLVVMDRWLSLHLVPEQLGIETPDALLFLLLTPILFLRKRQWILLAFLAVFLLSDMRNYIQWTASPVYSAREISQDLQARVKDGVITGQWAPELCLENRLRVVPVWYGFVNSENPFVKYGITHVLVWRYELGGEKFEEWYPDEFRQFHPVTEYRIKDSTVVLYEKEKTK